MRLIPDTNVHFVGRRRIFFVVSAVVVAAAIAVVAIKGFRYGVDFTGGSLVQVRFSEAVSISAVRAAVGQAGATDASVQQLDAKEYLIRAKPQAQGADQAGFSERLRQQFGLSFADNAFEVLRDESVGPRISKELQSKVLLAVAIGLVGILVYVSFRFDFRFGVAAVLSLIHDTAITLGFCALFGKEITTTLIAAVLTMIGYSVNDTIVVSDRIREDTRKIRKESYAEVCNSAINRVLGRTIITSLTVLLVSVALLVFASAEIRDFAFVMTVGTVVGTYSSVFVVVNTVVEWDTKFPTKRHR